MTYPTSWKEDELPCQYCLSKTYEKHDDCFRQGRDEFFMITSPDVKPDRRNKRPTVVHVSGTMRPQLVKRMSDINYKFPPHWLKILYHQNPTVASLKCYQKNRGKRWKALKDYITFRRRRWYSIGDLKTWLWDLRWWVQSRCHLNTEVFAWISSKVRKTEGRKSKIRDY